MKDKEGKTKEGKAKEGKDKEGKDKEGKAKEGKAKEGKAKEGKDKEWKAKEGKSKKGKANLISKTRRKYGRNSDLCTPCFTCFGLGLFKSSFIFLFYIIINHVILLNYSFWQLLVLSYK